MGYQAMYQKYQTALKFRELSTDENYVLLNEVFSKKIMDSINLNTQSHFIPYLAGIKEVFFYVNQEAAQVDFYRDELERIIAAEK